MAIQAISAGATALVRHYGFDNVPAFVVSHIETLKLADNPLANRCGAVLEAAQIGFGAGSESSLILIGIGRTLLGGGVAPAVAGVSLANPVTLTCAAIGAIHYGWNALSEEERTAILKTVGNAFATGIELVRSIATFALQTIRALLSSEQFAELKRLVAEGAALFDRRLGEVTRALSDRSRDAYDEVSGKLNSAVAMLPTLNLNWARRDGTRITPPATPSTPPKTGSV